jgi:hypothetical protein
MPRIDDPVIISSGYAFLEPRTPYGLHQLAGANTAMIEIMRDNIELLGLTATEAHFDSTLLWTQQMLTENSVELSFVNSSHHIIPDNNAYEVVIKVRNKVGHKFPSGYPSRRAFIEFIVHFEGDTVFHSGQLDPSGARILGSDDDGLEDYEPHYDVITNDSQVQIYEIVAGDVEMNPTNVLERAYVPLKDNRLVPLGFSVNHEVYDTTTVEGNVLLDPNFNFENEETQGSGTDEITYSLDISLFTDNWPDWDVTCNIWYQSMPPRWVESMFDYEDDAISEFQSLYEAQGSAAVLVGSVTDQVINLIDDVVEEQTHVAEVSISPNPAVDGFTTLSWKNISDDAIFELYDSAGARVEAGKLSSSTGSMQLELPSARGIYLVKVHHAGGIETKRVARP